jgi:cytoskeletal protein RodZ
MNRGSQVMSKEFPLDQQQAQQLTAIGDYLRQVREENLLSLEQMAAKTLIQVRLIRAIETGNLQPLPEPVYIRGFIKRYAVALGLDGAEIAQAFPIETDIRAVQPSWKDTPAAQLRPLHLWVAYLVLIVAAVSGLSYLISRSPSWVGSAQNRSQQPKLPVPVVAAASHSASQSASPPSTDSSLAPRKVPAPAIAGKPVRVNVTLTAQSWLRVEVDGKTDYEGVLPEGTQRTWAANSQVKVRAGNAGGVKVAYNEGQAKILGAPGAVEEVTFSTSSQDAAALPSSTNPLPQ